MQFFLLLLLLMFATPARAQLTTAHEYERMLDSDRGMLTADANMFFGRARVGRTRDAVYSFVQPTLVAAGRYREVVLEAALPFAYFYENNYQPDPDKVRFTIGNPWAALLYLPDCTCGLSRLSLGLAVDALQSKSPLARRAMLLSRGAVGDWDGYLFRDRLLPLVAGASTRLELSPLWRLSWDGDFVFGMPAGSRDFEFGMQHAGEIALVTSWHFTLAGRISASYYPTIPGDNFQSALTFYLRYVFVQDAVGARFVMNLDGPAGFAFSGDGMWGLGLFYSTSM